MNTADEGKPASNMQDPLNFTGACPYPIQNYPQVMMAHGGGGKLMHQLIGKMIVPIFGNPLLEGQHDASVFEVGSQRLAFTTDSYVVRPLFFPGGDIGSLAVNGTINDLAMCGAKPLYLSAGFILEEGLEMGGVIVLISALLNYLIDHYDVRLRLNHLSESS